MPVAAAFARESDDDYGPMSLTQSHGDKLVLMVKLTLQAGAVLSTKLMNQTSSGL